MDKKTEFVNQVKIGFFRKLRNRFWYFLGYIGPGNKLRVFANRRRGVHIGNNVFIDAMVHIDTAVPHLVTIEDNVKLSVGVKIFAHNSVFQDINPQDPIILSPVLIKKKAQIAPNAVILDGVTIGESSVIGACALVNKDIPDRVIAVGVPAKPIKNYDEARKAFLNSAKR
ncbi:MAG TPA: acyltransferase [Candidatus Omnitrophota bacterium]|nr:acyltransferase [Candidatus Omnitrophota bacterium]